MVGCIMRIAFCGLIWLGAAGVPKTDHGTVILFKPAYAGQRKESKMKRDRGFFMLLAMLVCLLILAGCEQKPKAASSSPALNMKEGLWEITTSVSIPGMPADMMKPQTFSTCLTRKESVPKGRNETDCTVKDVKTEGNTVSWTIVCKEATSKGRITYAGDTYEGVTESTVKQDGKDMTIKTTMKGKYVGPCQK
jgi:hypothetical protein